MASDAAAAAWARARPNRIAAQIRWRARAAGFSAAAAVPAAAPARIAAASGLGTAAAISRHTRYSVLYYYYYSQIIYL